MIDLAFRQVVQVTVVTLLAAAVMRWACRRRPHLAYVVGLLVLTKCWMPPVWSSPGGIFCWPPVGPGAAPRSEPRHEGPPKPAPAMIAAGVDRAKDRVEAGETNYGSLVIGPAPSEEAGWRRLLAGCLLAAWLTGMLVVVFATSVRWWRWHRRVVAAAVPAGDRLHTLAADIAGRVGLRRTPRLLLTTSTGGPAVYGLSRPTIVVPQRLLTADNAENLQMVLTHEALHVRRRDLYASLFQFATLAVWWFHPAIWWICRRLTQERERSCDEELLAGLHCSPRAYAQCLLDILRQQRHEIAPAFPGMRAVDVTHQRIENIMRPCHAACVRTPLRYWLFAALALLVILPGQRVNLASSGDAEPQVDETTIAQQNTQQVGKVGEAPPTPTEEAIDRGIRYLKMEQLADGHWPDPVGYPGGITGLCTLALLKSGVKPDERTAQAALTCLRPIKPSMTYNTSLQTLVLCAANAQAERPLIARNVKWLARVQKAAGPFAGAWGYPVAEGDGSNTAFAVWALYEADRAGVAVGNAVWQSMLNYWLNHQNADGSWGYKPQLSGTGSMTSQGMFCVAAAAKVLDNDKPQQRPAQAIEKAAAWLTNHFAVDSNPGSHGQQGWQFYYLLALAKAGRTTGRAQFGDHDWSAEAAKVLLGKQRPDGSWRGAGHAEDDPHVGTSLAILSLLKSSR